MTSSAAAPLSPTDLLDQQAGDAQHYRALLHELMGMGMGLARTVHEQATAQGTDPAATREAAKAFDLISRAVRRTVALARRVAEPLPARADPAQARAAARGRIIREVEDVTQWPDSDLDLDFDLDAEAAEAFRAELTERMDRAELDDETGRRPVEAIIASIYRDLGFDRFLRGHKRAPCTPPDMSDLRARAAEPPAAPGSAAPAPAAARHVEPPPGRRPFTPEAGIEPRHEALAVRNE